MLNCNSIDNSITGSGISEHLPEYVNYFTEVSVTETLKIPCQKPDMEKLLSVLVSADIVSARLVETPIAKSYEGQNLSGHKLIVEVRLREKIKYVADKPYQSVHAAHYDDTMKSVFVVVPTELNGQRICDLIRKKKYSVTPYIEDVYAIKQDCRTVYKCVTMLVDVKFF
ncbi:MAG: hypothetical protein ACRC28_14065 [Clostridium sp.]|uniref:hypothetical protein n=1 Tax=Clostridium sp. TaxID=1506 RepID=UPI003F314D88